MSTVDLDPMPSDEGRRKGLFVRLPADLHKELVRLAGEQEVSLNQLLVALLAGATGFSLKPRQRR